MGDERRGVHPAWVCAAGLMGAMLGLVGAGYPLLSARTQLREQGAELSRLERALAEARAEEAALEDQVRLERARRDEADARAAAQLEEAQADLAQLRARLAQAEEQARPTDPAPSSEGSPDPRAARRLQTEARALFRAGKVPEAIERLSSAIAAAPRDPGLFVDRGYLRLQTEDTQGAVADFEAALRIDSNHAMAWNNLAMVRVQQKDGRRALELAHRALRCDGNLVNAWIMCTAAANLVEDWREVQRAARGALERLPPQDPRRAIVLARLKRAQAALAGEGGEGGE